MRNPNARKLRSVVNSRTSARVDQRQISQTALNAELSKPAVTMHNDPVRSVANWQDDPNASVQGLYKLEMENAELRNTIINLALEIHGLRSLRSSGTRL